PDLTRRTAVNHRELGRTGWRVSEVGFGAWAIGGADWGGADDAESLAALHRAIDQGETFSGVDYEAGLAAVGGASPLVPPGATLAQLALRWIRTIVARPPPRRATRCCPRRRPPAARPSNRSRRPPAGPWRCRGGPGSP